MGLLDCVASPEGRDSFDVAERRPIYKPNKISRSDHDISRRRALPLFSSQSSLKTVRDVDFWRQGVVRFLFAPEGREDVRVLRVPLNQLGYAAITDFIGAIPEELFEEYQAQPPPDEGLLKDDKVFWVRDGIAEPGTFKWKGNIGTDSCVGLQLDRKKAVPFGTYDGKGLFYCKPGHRALVPEHEVIPYKKFLRRFLGVPQRKDSVIGSSVRLSAKAIAAKNSKPGDRVYLPKEKKWAIVQWIGKIDGETVVDIIYEPPKAEAGMPVSPDEPCISRSFSMADFIDEVGASEPNTPITAQPPQEQPKLEEPTAPTKPLPPSPPPLSSDESEDSELTTSDDDDDDDDDDDESDSGEGESEVDERESEVDEVEMNANEGEREARDKVREEEENDETDAKAVKSDTESEKSVSQESINLENAPTSKRSSLRSAASSKRSSLQVTELQVLQNDVPEAQLSIQTPSPMLPSPKRKGFFKFSPNKKRSKSPRPVTPVEEPEIENLPSPTEPTEPEHERSPSPVLRPAKSSNIFSSLRFKKSKKPAKEVEMAEPEEIEEPKQVPKKKNKSEWSIIFFKPKNKTPIEKLTLAQSSRIECTTPIDEMVPPDKIPTPPPQTDEFDERRIERPEFIPFPSVQPGEENRKKGLGKPVEPPTVPETFAGASSQHFQEASLSPNDNSSESESSESEDELDAGGQQVAATVEMHVPPIETSVSVNVNRQEQNLSTDIANLSDSESSEDERIPEREVSPPPASNASSESPVEKLEQNLPANQSVPIDKFKETTIRNRPSSFGSFLRRIKNPSRKPEEGQKIPPSPTLVHEPSIEQALPVVTHDNNAVTIEEIVSPIRPQPQQQIQDANPEQETTPQIEGYKMLTESESSLSDAGIQKEELDEPKVVAQARKTLVRPTSTVEGNQDGIILDLLDLDEPTPPFISPPPVPAEESPKRKQSWNRSFSFSFSKKRKGSYPQPPTTPAPPVPNEPRDSDKENEESSVSSKERGNQELQGEKENDQKSSLASSFRNSFRRTFSLTKKRHTSVDSEGETVKSPPSSINRPRPVTLYFDNNEVAQVRQSFRNKRPASVVVDIQPWSNRRGGDEVDIYNSPRSSQDLSSPLKSPNPALEPKQPEPAIPKHRIFTTPSIFYKKNKKTEEQVFSPKPAKTSLYKKWNSAEVGAEKEEQPQTPIDDITSPSNYQPPPLPTTPLPIFEAEKPASNFPFMESGGSIDGQSPKLKSALKQRKEIDCIPNGLKINDRVMWYSGKEPVPGTVQRLFKDGTDKYTAMVKFDREVKTEPLRLIREGDAYMITVEELITPGMFTPTNVAQNDTSPTQSISAPQTPMTPSVRFDNVKDAEQDIPHVTITEVNDELDLPPPFQEEEVNMACGFNRGIQCRDRSCCLETVLFSLFYTTNAFDIAMLYGNSPNEDSLTKSVRTILRREIVDPLRREGFCAWPAIKKLRDAVKPLSDEWQTLSTDAEVMMFILFDRALKLGKFISYSNDMSDYLHQLVVDTKDLSKSTTVQHLFETSLQLMDKLKLKTIPTPALIMEMPRSNDKLVQYKAVIPNLSLHVSRVLDDGSRLCICGVVAKHECRKCSANFGSRSIVFCDNCKGTADIIHFQLTHQAELISLNQSIVIMDLAAILCVKQGHYSSFVRCGNEKLSPWVYFDGGEAENPKVCIEQNLGMWLERLEKYPGKYHDALQYPLLTHILQDSHICVYQPREKSSSV